MSDANSKSNPRSRRFASLFAVSHPKRTIEYTPVYTIMPSEAAGSGHRSTRGIDALRVFAESQWSALVLPTLKLSTPHGYKNVLNRRMLPYWREWRIRDIGKLDKRPPEGSREARTR